MSSAKKITIHSVVFNEAKKIRYILDSFRAQTYKDFEVVVFDNNSNDETREIVKNEYPEFRLYMSPQNYGVWGGLMRSYTLTGSPYVVMTTDVIFDKYFLEKMIAVIESDSKIGAAQGKALQCRFHDPTQLHHGTWDMEHGTKNNESVVIPARAGIHNGHIEKLNTIDTTGFQIFRSRRVINRGQGEEDLGQYDKTEEIFGVEGLCVMFRREAIEDCRLCTQKFTFEDKEYCEFTDESFFWYGDDLDFAWRMRLFGWKEYYVHDALMWHDRSTTRGIKKHWYDYFRRLRERRRIPIFKRRLDWRNKHLAMVKNELAEHFRKDFWHILKREILSLGYHTLFEPQILLEIPQFFKMLPSAKRKRHEIMTRLRVAPQEMSKWFQ